MRIHLSIMAKKMSGNRSVSLCLFNPELCLFIYIISEPNLLSICMIAQNLGSSHYPSLCCDYNQIVVIIIKLVMKYYGHCIFRLFNIFVFFYLSIQFSLVCLIYEDSQSKQLILYSIFA